MIALDPRQWPRGRPWLWIVAIEAIALCGLVVVVAVAFSVIVLGLGHVPTDDQRSLLGTAAVAAGVSALAWVPVRARLTDAATTLLRGDREAPEAVLRPLEGVRPTAVPFDELLLRLAESLRRVLALERAEIWIAAGSLLERLASDPERPPASVVLTDSELRTAARAGVSGPAWSAVWLPVLVADSAGPELRLVPVAHGGELLGLILVQRGATGPPFDDREERVLAEVGRRIALTLSNVRLDSALQASLDELRMQAAELRASRARIVAAADAERRRIERDLHDGAQQHLVALAVNLRLARELAEPDPVGADELLARLGRDAQDALEQVRALAHGIYPPLLLDSGLEAALCAAAARAAVAVRLEAAGLARYPANIEATVYFCCLEALQNAAKHAGETARVTVRVREEHDSLAFEVTDDGAGFDPERRGRGSGLVNMADRLGAVGGRLSVRSQGGRGTSVAGTIPLGGTTAPRGTAGRP